ICSPSRTIERCGFSPARRAATGISTRSSTSGVRRRFWYSRKPSLTHSGNRVPAAITRHLTMHFPLLRSWRLFPIHSGARGPLGGRHVPELFEAVELSDARQHDVHDQFIQIDEHPVAILLSFYAVRSKAGRFGL